MYVHALNYTAPSHAIFFCLYSVKWIDLDGIMYKKPSSLVVRNMDSEAYPTFGKLLKFMYTTLEFNSWFHCFCVQLSTVKYVNNLFSVHPHHVRLLPRSIR